LFKRKLKVHVVVVVVVDLVLLRAADE